MFAFQQRISEDSEFAEHAGMVTGGLCGCAAISPGHPFRLKELGAITMVSMAHLADVFHDLLG
jgi:hypothetical protein